MKPENAEEAISLFKNSVIPAAKKQKGFISLMLLTDRTTGKAVTVGLWETEADMKANEASGYLQEQNAKFADFLIKPLEREEYEVVAQS